VRSAIRNMLKERRRNRKKDGRGLRKRRALKASHTKTSFNERQDTSNPHVTEHASLNIFAKNN